jgi:hypothetical protein
MSEVARQPILADLAEEFPAYQALLGKLFSRYTSAFKIAAEYDNLESIIAGSGSAAWSGGSIPKLGPYRLQARRAASSEAGASASADCDRLPQRTRLATVATFVEAAKTAKLK